MMKEIRNYIKNGGKFVLTYFSGLVDENDLCWMNEVPHGINDVFGIERVNTDPLMDEESIKINGLFESECHNMVDIIKNIDAKELLKFDSDIYDNGPCVTVKQYDKGLAYYIAGDMDEDGLNKLFDNITKDMKPIFDNTYDKVSVHQRGEYVLVQSFNENDVTITEDYDLVYGDSKILHKYDGIVLKKRN